MNRKTLQKETFNQITDEAVSVIANGGVVIAPFDTVYGFLADAANEAALAKIYKLKDRPPGKPFGLVLDSIETLRSGFNLSPELDQYVDERIPGRYTFVLRPKDTLHVSNYCKKDGTTGVRFPDSQLITAIASKFGKPLAQTSANKAGKANAFSPGDIEDQFNGEELNTIDLVIDDGKIESNGPSEIVDLTGDTPKRIERK